jgi:hypothetical protein
LSLLEEDRYLLDIDFTEIGNVPSATRQVWILEMEAAAAAARYDASADGEAAPHYSNNEVPIDTEGSIWFRRRRH